MLCGSCARKCTVREKNSVFFALNHVEATEQYTDSRKENWNEYLVCATLAAIQVIQLTLAHIHM